MAIITSHQDIPVMQDTSSLYLINPTPMTKQRERAIITIIIDSKPTRQIHLDSRAHPVTVREITNLCTMR